nr:hypothetical protein Q903MT_gene1303 [Picea sitchensis]
MGGPGNIFFALLGYPLRKPFSFRQTGCTPGPRTGFRIDSAPTKFRIVQDCRCKRRGVHYFRLTWKRCYLYFFTLWGQLLPASFMLEVLYTYI